MNHSKGGEKEGEDASHALPLISHYRNTWGPIWTENPNNCCKTAFDISIFLSYSWNLCFYVYTLDNHVLPCSGRVFLSGWIRKPPLGLAPAQLQEGKEFMASAALSCREKCRWDWLKAGFQSLINRSMIKPLHFLPPLGQESQGGGGWKYWGYFSACAQGWVIGTKAWTQFVNCFNLPEKAH